MKQSLKVLVAASFVLCVSNALAANEFVKKTFVASNKLQLPYRAAEKADPNGGKVPVVVFLHGYGQCGVDNSFTINEMTNIKSYLDGAGVSGGYKLLVPQCPNDVKWAEFSMESPSCTFQEKPSSALVAVFDLLDSYAAMEDVDADRIYVTGLSMGGHGTWDAICRRPDFFAAAMPCCGGGDPACAADIAHVPVLAVHNRGDPTIPVEQTEGIVTALRALGSDVIFEKLENNSHDAWTTCYATEDDVTAGAPNHRFVWMFAQNRATNNRPKYPRIAELAAEPSGSNATISLAGVVLGTDADSVPATKYSVTYKLDGAANAVTALSNQTADSSFTLEGLADGNHTCEVTMTTDKGRTKTKSVVFYVNTSAASDVWTSAAMDASGSSFRTDGTLLYAYSSNGGTVNGIRFERDVNLQSSSLKVAFVPNIDSFTGEFMNDGAGGDFGVMLSNGWYWNNDDSSVRTFKLTLSGLTGGKDYLVQFLSHNYWNNNITVSANGCSPVHIHGENEASGKYGALITGTFTAMGDTKEVTITYSNVNGKIPLNAIQVRDLGESSGGGGSGSGGEVTVVEPSIESASVTTNGTVATVFLSGIAMGTDDAGTNATSYSVSYSLTNAPAVTALSNQTGATASFSISDLADGSYTCSITIATDKNKTATKMVSFAISASSQGGSGGGGSGNSGDPTPLIDWTVETLSASDETMLRTDGTLLYAYRGASTDRTLGGITFQAGADLSSANISFSPAFVNAGANAGSSSLLGEAWNFGVDTSMADIRLTLSGLTAGHAYLLQILARNSYGNAYITIGDLPSVSIQNVNGSSGATVYGSFTAEAASHVVTFKMGGSGAARYVAAIQVRDLGESSGGGGSGGGETVEPIVPGPDTTNTLYLAKIAEYAFASNGCGAITYSGQGGVFYVLQDHADDNYARIHPLALGIDPSTGAILSQTLGTAFTPAGLRDAEGLALDPLSGTLWASSEWEPPSISEFGLDGLATGRTAPVPSIQRDKLRSNLSLESLTISPDGLTMWTANEQALECDGESSSGNTTVSTVVRLTRYTRETAQGGWQAAGEWAYICDPCAGTTSAQSGLSGLCALPDGSLLALEREVSTTTCGRCRIYRLTTGALAAATEVSAIPALTNATFSAVGKGECLLEFTGPSPSSLLGPYELIVYEGIALGPKLSDGSRAVYLVSDGGTTMTKLVYGITITATTVSRICALKLTGLADEGEPTAIQDWPANPDAAITDATRPSDLGIVAGAFATSATTTAELRKLAKWAKANGVPFAGADVNAMAFDADGNPDNAFSTAYLLDCAVDEVAEKKAAFRFTAFTPETVPSIDGSYNGTVTVQGAGSLADPWVAPATPQHRFFRAILTR